MSLTSKSMVFMAGAAAFAYCGYRLYKKLFRDTSKSYVEAGPKASEATEGDDPEYLNLGSDFLLAAELLRQDPTLKFNDDDRLSLYGLYKVAVVGECTLPKPSLWEFEANAKYHAWKSAEPLCQIPGAAMKEYLRIVETLVPDWRERCAARHVELSNGIQQMLQEALKAKGLLDDEGKIKEEEEDETSEENLEVKSSTAASKPPAPQTSLEDEEVLTASDLLLAEGERDDDGYVPKKIGENGQVLAVDLPRPVGSQHGAAQGGSSTTGLREVRGHQLGTEEENAFVQRLLQHIATQVGAGDATHELQAAEDEGDVKADVYTLKPADIDLLEQDVDVLVKALADNPKLATAHDATGSTLLHIAVDSEPKTPYIQVLVDAKADVNAEDGAGIKPLQSALWSGNASAIRTLLELGADAKVVDSDGQTVLDIFELTFDDNEEESQALRELLERAQQ